MILPNLQIEKSLWQGGYRYIVGIDEVGRGSWAGPFVAAGVILPISYKIPDGLADSKLVKPRQRLALAKIIEKEAIGFAIVQISPRKIDKIGIGGVTHLAFRKIVRSIKPAPDFCLIDAFHIRYLARSRQLAVKDGDKICASIAAASIIAKVHRDNLMKKLAYRYPNWGFAKHKGYGTRSHQQAIRQFGLSRIHRTSYKLNFLFA